MEGIIGFSDWSKVDLRVAEILEVENIEGADRLYKLKINLGFEKRTLVAGIKQYYSMEKLKGKKIIVVSNLEPKKLRGVESKGMLLAASTSDKSVVRLLEPDGEIEIGSKIF